MKLFMHVVWHHFFHLLKQNKKWEYPKLLICHGKTSNLVEFDIIPVETPIEHSTKFSLVESPIGVFTGGSLEFLP